jgi:hypothetical protein
VLAIVALTGFAREIIAPIATIVFGAASLIQGGTLLSEYAHVIFPAGSSPALSERFSGRGGAFSNIHQHLMKEIRQRSKKLRARVDAAAREGAHGNLLKTEFVRDYDLLFDDFEQ